MKRIVRVEIQGYFEIDESELSEGYEATTFEQAVANQLEWINAGETGIMELLSERYPINTTLMLLPEGAEVL